LSILGKSDDFTIGSKGPFRLEEFRNRDPRGLDPSLGYSSLDFARAGPAFGLGHDLVMDPVRDENCSIDSSQKR